MASALNEKKVTPETDYIDSGMVKIGGWPIYNYGHRAYGRQTMTNVLEHSVNTGVVFAQSRLGDEPFVEYLEKFGIFEPTGIDLPETFSANAEFKKGYAINYATASFGQGIWMTSIQLIRAYSALANGGVLVRPSVAKIKQEETPPARQHPPPAVSVRLNSRSLVNSLQRVWALVLPHQLRCCSDSSPTGAESPSGGWRCDTCRSAVNSRQFCR